MREYKLVKANKVGRDFVVGDVHGMFDRVAQALTKVQFNPSRDRLFSVGDLIDRGPQSDSTATMPHPHGWRHTR